MLYTQNIRILDITDGTAHTLMVSEDSGWQDGQWINGLNVFDVAFAINTAPPFENDPRSKHKGGVNGLMADGSARFLANEIGPERPGRDLHPQRRRAGGRFLTAAPRFRHSSAGSAKRVAGFIPAIRLEASAMLRRIKTVA